MAQAVAAGIKSSSRRDGHLAVYAVTKAARGYAVAGNGPVLIRAMCYQLRSTPYLVMANPLPTRRCSEEWRAKTHSHSFPYLPESGLWSQEKERSGNQTRTKERSQEAIKLADQALNKFLTS